MSGTTLIALGGAMCIAFFIAVGAVIKYRQVRAMRHVRVSHHPRLSHEKLDEVFMTLVMFGSKPFADSSRGNREQVIEAAQFLVEASRITSVRLSYSKEYANALAAIEGLAYEWLTSLLTSAKTGDDRLAFEELRDLLVRVRPPRREVSDLFGAATILTPVELFGKLGVINPSVVAAKYRDIKPDYVAA